MGFFLLGLIVIYELSLFDRDLDMILKKYRSQKHDMIELLNESPETKQPQQQIYIPRFIFIRSHVNEPSLANRDIRRFRYMRLRNQPERFGQVHHYRLIKKLQQHQDQEQHQDHQFADYMRESIKQKFNRHFNNMHTKLISRDLVKGVEQLDEKIWDKSPNVSGQIQKVYDADSNKKMGDTGDKAEIEIRNEKLRKEFNPVPFSISKEVKDGINVVFKYIGEQQPDKTTSNIVNSNYEYEFDSATGKFRKATKTEKPTQMEVDEDVKRVDEDTDEENKDVGEIGTPFMKDD